MLEVRQNIATREWVIISTERAKRPEEYARAPHHAHDESPVYVPSCPFCPGNEELELERLRLPDRGDWQLRVVRNKFPALREHGERTRHSDGVNYAISGVGYHEVVVESRRHNTCPALEPVEEVERTLAAFQLRSLAIREDQRIEQLVVFKNHGPDAGTSLSHPHAQLLALPVVPYSIRTRVEAARRYFDDHGECVLCHMRENEELDASRLVCQSEYFVAFIPYAANSPFHLWIVPRHHQSGFLEATAEELRDLATILREVLRKIYFGLNDPDYNYIIRTAPEHEQRLSYLHWYVTIIPRVTRTAGFEMGSGMFINTAPPEESAAFLRGVTRHEDSAP